jgi:Zn-dependent protease
MFGGQGIKIFRVSGIDIEIQPTWLFIFALFVYNFQGSVASDFSIVFPQIMATFPFVSWLFSIVLVLLLFASLICHELAHALVARYFGATVEKIQLFILGGVALITQHGKSDGPKESFVYVAVGPLTSLALAGVMYVLSVIIPLSSDHFFLFMASRAAFYLMWMNLIVGIFNLLPAFPMDGGRMAVALIRMAGVRREKAVQVGVMLGMIFSILFAALGIYQVVVLNQFQGIWFAALAVFLFMASSAEGKQVKK